MLDAWTDIRSLNNMATDVTDIQRRSPCFSLIASFRQAPGRKCNTRPVLRSRNHYRGRNEHNWIISWSGDISHFAIDIIRDRRLRDTSIPLHNFPRGVASAVLLSPESPFAFEKWVVTRIPGLFPN